MTHYKYDSTSDSLFIFLHEDRKARLTQGEQIILGVWINHDEKNTRIDGMTIKQWEQEWSANRQEIVDVLATRIVPPELPKAVLEYEPYMGHTNRRFLWKVELKEGCPEAIATCHVLAAYQRDAAIKGVAHFYDRFKKVGASESRSGQGFWEYQHIPTGQIVGFHPHARLVVSLHSYHIRQGMSHLGNLVEYATDQMLEVLEEADNLQKYRRMQRYVGTIWHKSPEHKLAGRLLATSGCVAESRSDARDLVSHNWLANNWDDQNWRIRIAEYSPMCDDSGRLISDALLAELRHDVK